MHYESFYCTNLLFFGLIPRHFEKTRVPGLDFNDVWILLRHTTSLVIGKFLSHGKNPIFRFLSCANLYFQVRENLNMLNLKHSQKVFGLFSLRSQY